LVLNIDIIEGEDAIAIANEIYNLRISSWKPFIDDEIKLNRFTFDNFDSSGCHVCIRNDGHELIAASRLCVIYEGETLPDEISFSLVKDKMTFPAIFLNRSVVHPLYRGNNLWELMINKRLELANTLDAREIWIETCANRKAHLINDGFKVIGPSQDKEIAGDWFLLRKILSGD